jgi:hypothetical protein
VASEPINIPIKTTYDDDAAKEALKDAEKIDNLNPTVEIEADTGDADSEIAGLTDSAQELVARNPWVAEFMAETGAAKADLEGLQSKLTETGDKADTAKKQVDKIGTTQGPRLAGNQVADLTGPLGDASGAASNFGGIFDGLADIAEKVAPKVGLSAEKMAGAISGIGFAVAGAAAVWTIYQQEQEKVKKKQKELVDGQKDINKALKDARLDDAAAAFVKTYADALAAADKLGISTKHVVDYITGVSDVVPEATKGMDDFQSKLDLAAINGAKLTFEKSNDSLAVQDEKLKDVAQSLGGYQAASGDAVKSSDDLAAATERAKRKADDLTAAFDALQGNLDITRESQDMAADFDNAFLTIHSGMQPTLEDLRGLEDDILRAGEVAGANPIDVKMALQKISDGDLAGAHADAQSWLNQHQLTVQIKASAQSVQDVINKISNPFRPAGTAAAATSTTIVNNLNLPRGARHSDIARAMQTTHRRSGRRYANPVVHYARR